MHLKSSLPDTLFLWLEPGDKPMLPTSLVSHLKTVVLNGPGVAKYRSSLPQQYPSITWKVLATDPVERNFTSDTPRYIWWYRPHLATYHWDPYIFYQLKDGLHADLTLAVEEVPGEMPHIALNPFNRLVPDSSHFNGWQILRLGLISKDLVKSHQSVLMSQELSTSWPATWDVAGLPQRSLNPIYDKSAVFIDRDGVLNHRLPGDYVKKPEEFEWLPNTWKAVRRLSTRFDYLFIVTNQQGVGKGLMSGADLDVIHMQMLEELQNSKARVDGIYQCIGLSFENPPCRKPNTGMAWEAKEAFPDFSWSRSWMAGDTLSDLTFGLRLGMRVGAIMDHANSGEALLADRVCPDLYAFARSFKSNG